MCFFFSWTSKGYYKEIQNLNYDLLYINLYYKSDGSQVRPYNNNNNNNNKGELDLSSIILGQINDKYLEIEHESKNTSFKLEFLSNDISNLSVIENA